MQLNLFGEEPVEAPMIAPINDVVSVPKKYKLVPPTNIVLETESQQVQKNIEKENIVVQKKETIQKVKKEKIVSVISNNNSEHNTESTKTKEPKIRTIIALDLFAEIIPERIETTIPETISESIPVAKQEDIPKANSRFTQMEIPDVILEVTPENISEPNLEVISDNLLESIPEVIQEVIQEVQEVIQEDIPEAISKISQRDIPEVIPENISEDIPETVVEKTPIAEIGLASSARKAKASHELKPKYVLKIPNVIKISETEPIQEINKAAIPEDQPIKIDEVVAPILPEAIEKKEQDIPPSIIEDEEELSVKSSKGRSAGSQFHADLLLINIPDDDVLFTKQYYPISEVATMFNVKVSLLRFWENEFDILKPRKNRKGDRLFRPEDVKNLKLIYFLLREKKYTIEGAKMFIKKGKNVKEKFAAIESLKKIKGMLMELKAGLSF